MARPKKLTPIAVAQIPCWVAHGLSAAEIAEKLGCTLGTLRVRCSQLGISLRRPASVAASSLAAAPPQFAKPSEHEFHVGGLGIGVDLAGPDQRPAPGARWCTLQESGQSSSKSGGQLLISLSSLALDHLRRRASVKGVSGATLASMLLEAIAQDDLYTAVLDN